MYHLENIKKVTIFVVCQGPYLQGIKLSASSGTALGEDGVCLKNA
jgi:hypothetical protein